MDDICIKIVVKDNTTSGESQSSAGSVGSDSKPSNSAPGPLDGDTENSTSLGTSVSLFYTD